MPLFVSTASHVTRNHQMSQGKRLRRRWLLVLALLLAILAGCKTGTPAGTFGCADQIVISEEAATSVEARVRQAIDNGDSVSIVVTNEEATSYLRLRQQFLPLRDAVICFKANEIRLEGLFALSEKTELQIQANLTASVQDGLVQVEAQDIAVNGINLPGWARNTIEKPINDALADVRPNFRVDEISPSEGSLLIEGEME
ncbi:MAG: hypothetical protein A2Y73_04200 [Chloroflexi bacterium RBG_13_56_8]|nr:MAG: hypothetical protein A2Y73_04200 [Chloroflexi bacterium RBG_13_56_8]